MELRRALLLFAIVLGLAAIAASVSRPAVDDQTDTAGEPPRKRAPATAAPSSRPGPPAEIAFEADLQPETRAVPAGGAVTVTVTAYEPGQVEIEPLGLTAPAEPDAPARFDVLAGSPEKYAVTFTPVATGDQRKIGIIEVEM